jgi:hypothetical protein
MRTLVAMIIACSALLLSGCADVKPWDRDLLAQKKMQLVPAPVDNALDEHVYFSKEAASGGQGVGGGGCGCN